MVDVTVAPMFLGGGAAPRTLKVGARTMGRVIEEIEGRHPGFRDAVTTELGTLRPHIGIYVNGERVNAPNLAELRLRDDDRVHVLPSVSGG